MATITIIKQRISELDSGSFQILCDDYLSKEGYNNIVCLGTKEGTRKTTKGTPDTYFREPQGKYIFVEYTTQKENLLSKIESDINKCLDVTSTSIPCEEISEIIYCHTSSNITPEYDRKFREKCEKYDIKFILIGIDKLANDIYSKYKSIAKEHLSLPIDTEQIQLVEDFIKQYNANKLAAPVDTPFLFRDKEIEELDAAFKRANVVILSGAAGTGKTRLALQYAMIHSQGNFEKLYCIHDRALPILEDLCVYFEKPNKYFILIDDANQVSNLSHIIEYANKSSEGYDVNILITVRDYAIDRVKSSINNVADYEIVNIKVFSDDQIKELVKKTLRISNQDCLDRIALIASGNARIAILSGRIAYKSNRLDSIDDVSDLYSEYFGSIIKESELHNDEELLISAGIMAFLEKLHLDKMDPLAPLLNDFKLNEERFEKALKRLHELEIVDIYYDKAVKFSEQCFSNFILKYVFYDKKIISLSTMIEECFTPYKTRVIASVNTLLNIFCDAGLQEFVQSEIKQLWSKMSKENSPYFMEFVKSFFIVNPTETLIILDKRINSVESVSILVSNINTEDGKNNKIISDDIITILGGFADSSHLECALDLFFKYYLKRPDLYLQFYHATIMYFSVCKNSYKYDYHTLIKYIEKIIEVSNDWENEYITLLFLDLSNELLNLDFQWFESNIKNDGMTIYTMFLTESEGVRLYRNLIWSNIIKICYKNTSKYCCVKKLLYGYANRFDEKSHDVIKKDAILILDLFDRLFSKDDLSDSIIALHLQSVFESVGLQYDELNDFLNNNNKLTLYKLLKGPKRSEYYDYDKRKTERIKRMNQYIEDSSDKLESIKSLFEIYREYVNNGYTNSYDLHEGITTIIDIIGEDPNDFICLIDFFIENGFEQYFNPSQILQRIFSYLSAEEVYNKISKITTSEYNNWMYSYFSEIPKELVTVEIAKRLRSFLKDTSDSKLVNHYLRDINFLEKYIVVDENIFIDGIKLIFEKKNYSANIVNCYLQFLFYEKYYLPDELLNKFKDNIILLEDIYIWLELHNSVNDTNGAFLFEICNRDNEFLNKYIQSVYDSAYMDYKWNKLCVFYNSDNFLQIYDSIFKQLMNLSPYPMVDVTEIIRKLITKTQIKEDKKARIWIKHFIEQNSHNKDEMVCLFASFSQCDIEQRIEYIQTFLSENNDFEIFKSLPLTPINYSWSGSAVPMYLNWIEFLEKILPLLSGLIFLNHQNHIRQKIELFHKMIEEEQIMNILYE